ncbi:Gfo/Idh/MocA family protein [Microbacterium rhizosphaerae]|uniref:Gfo/Idh/MocA family oxidoreductase n=1 Tax=Microbacterium rhizosphaerae TaxID=1678237 RepID=A0ABZ0SQX9_9MICO|nr:Gfo/Idh/MocA family oxidoreductase [Microbacterium rhizosphaerae]WPR89632.1 Gfo/Idh/MocA family oxidoreductase [Microbacterium rhizosphaerae]
MTRTGRVGVGLIGAGMISNQYLTNLSQYPDVEVVAVGDMNAERAAAQAAAFGVPRSGDAASILADDDVEIVVNLTIPAAHVEVSTAALEAGKHVWSEKPIGIDRAAAQRLVELAKERDLLLGVAPDTVLGPRWQTAKRAIQAGVIGTPLTATTAFQSQGPDWFHPDPEFLFAQGAGPLFDMGPYYLSALVHLLGPITQVVAVGTKAYETRTIRSGPRAGTTFPVEVPTHLTVVSRLANGEAASSLMSTDTALFRHGVFEVNGTEGTLVLGDPNYFGGGDLKLYRPITEFRDGRMAQEPEIIAEEGPLSGRGVGALTMARTIRRGGDLHIATGEVGYHVLDAMTSIEESVERQAFVDIRSTVAPIPALPADFDPFAATLTTSV